jgi:hypothetical protein
LGGIFGPKNAPIRAQKTAREWIAGRLILVLDAALRLAE